MALWQSRVTSSFSLCVGWMDPTGQWCCQQPVPLYITLALSSSEPCLHVRRWAKANWQAVLHECCGAQIHTKGRACSRGVTPCLLRPMGYRDLPLQL